MDKNDDFEDRANNDEDNFGLPEVNYDPLDEESSQRQDEMNKPDSSRQYNYSEDEEEGSKSKTILIIVIIALLAMGGIYGYFFYLKPKMEREKQEELAKQKRVKQVQEKARLATLQQEEEQARQKAIEDSIANAQAAPQHAHSKGVRGTIGNLNAPTGRYHIVISSGIDDDLLLDYAKRLRRKGISTKLISPYGKIRLHRLTIHEDYDTYAQAQQKIGEIGSEYKYGSWVLKY